ncbi:MAG TPA: DUF6093 family protein [Candidatus Bathyarchaeia archaeon]|nr:DUF6093 family protein [Candidatus Bathyarchaeia archaeon]
MGLINYKRHRRQIEKLYEDTCTIYRFGDTTDPDTSETVQKPMPVYEAQSCRISQKSLATNGQTEAQNDIQYETKLFIAPELEIFQGDMIQVTRGGVTRKYTAGEPFPYPTHQEISIQRKEWA